MKSGLSRVVSRSVLLLALVAAGEATAQGQGARRDQPQSRLQARVSMLEARVSELAEALRALEQAPAPVPAPAPATPPTDRMERLALTMLDLQAALSTSRPFAREWRDLRAAYGDPLPISAASTLDLHAPRGLPAMTDLRDAFGPVSAQFLSRAALADGSAGWLRRLWRSALAWAGLETSSAASLLPQLVTRVETALSRGQLEAAVVEVEAMEERFGSNAASSAWLAQARTRLASEAALQDIIRRAFERRTAG